MISELQQITIPKNDTVIKKAFNDESLAYNLIYGDVAYRLSTGRVLDKSETRRLSFRTEVYKELDERLFKKYCDLQRKLYEIEDDKRKLERKKRKFQKYIEDTVPFVDDNNGRYIKTLEIIKKDIRLSKLKNNQLEEIKMEISFLMKRKAFFVSANIQLKNYENFLLDVLSILPSDYVKGLKENNLNALLRRYKSLLFMNRVITSDLNRTSNALRSLMKDLDTCHHKTGSLQSQRSIRLPQMNNRLLKVENELSTTMTNYIESYTILRQKMHIFGVMLRSINNITNKVFQIMERGFVCELDTNLDPQVLAMDPETKFKRIEDFIDYTLQIIEIIESKQLLI